MTVAPAGGAIDADDDDETEAPSQRFARELLCVPEVMQSKQARVMPSPGVKTFTKFLPQASQELVGAAVGLATGGTIFGILVGITTIGGFAPLFGIKTIGVFGGIVGLTSIGV